MYLNLALNPENNRSTTTIKNGMSNPCEHGPARVYERIGNGADLPRRNASSWKSSEQIILL